jgi:hypothetical protein
MELQHHALPTIPVPRPDVESLCSTVEALKQVVERFMRAPKPMGTGRRPMMIVQTTQPMGGAQDGDFWLCVGEKTTLNVMVSGVWHTVGSLV